MESVPDTTVPVYHTMLSPVKQAFLILFLFEIFLIVS